jgi:hypothetical protein
MSNCHSIPTPIDMQAKLSTTIGDPINDPSLYHSLVRGLQYLTLTRPNIAYVIQQACFHMHDPREPHLALIKRILWYVKGTLAFGLQLHATPMTSLTAYSDADWVSCPDSQCSTSGFCVYLGDSLIPWSSKRQMVVSRSSTEAEYHVITHAMAECYWKGQLLEELHQPLRSMTIVYCDNVSTVCMIVNLIHHQ